MDMGYVVILLLVLVYCVTAMFLFIRARQERPTPEPTPEEAPPEEPAVP